MVREGRGYTGCIMGVGGEGRFGTRGGGVHLGIGVGEGHTGIVGGGGRGHMGIRGEGGR